MSAVSGNYSHRVIGTIFLISFGIYLFLATATYTPFDPGWMHVSSDTREVSNASGIGGAWFADLLYGVIGWSALLLPLFLFLEAIQLWWPRSYLTPVFRYAAQFFIILTTSALLCFFWQVPGLSLANTSGGIVGYEIALSLSGILTSIGAIIFLSVFWFVLWTLAFKIEWLKTGATLRALPDYLKDLFYKNVPPEAEDFDLTIHKSHAIQNKKDLKIDTDIAEHTAIDLNQFEAESENLIASDQQKIRQLDSKIAAQPRLQPKEAKSFEEDVAESSPQVMQSGDVWRAKPIESSNTEKLTLQDLSNEFDKKPTVQIQKVQEKPKPIEAPVQVHHDEEVDISDLIAEADRQLQDDRNSKQAAIVEKTQKTPSNPMDWSDDEIFDELLAAVPLDQKPVQPTAKIQEPEQKAIFERQDEPFEASIGTPHVAQPKQDLTDFGDLDDVFNDLDESIQPTVHSNRVHVNTHTENLIDPRIDDENTTRKELSKEEFIAEWQETAGKPKEFEWDDLDAPLTDASGRPVSRAMQVVAHRKTLSRLPGLDLLDPVDPNKKVNFTAEQLSRLSELLELKLQDFNVKAQVIEAHPGPVVTRFELDLAPGVKASKVTNISRDLARSMSMASVRVVEVIPGKPYIGIEVPNSTREMVRLIELLETPAYRDPSALLSMAMGKDISGNPVLADLAKAPHMLVAGTTGSGKSVAVNSMLLSMLLKYTPEELRLIMIDPKQLELANYNDIPHLLTPVVTDMKDAVSALNWCVNEMERRYKLMSLLKIRKLADYNRKVEEAIANGEDLLDPTWKPGDSATQERAPRLTPLPLIVIVADEFADMIMQVGKKAEEMITRLAQKSRAAGIHLLLATQRPTVDVVTGLIKANIPTRAALRVNSKIDSRTILDAGGAEDLLGHGDMLFLGPGKIEPERVHGAFISDDEVNRICDAWRERGSPNYVDEILTPYDEDTSSSGSEYDSGDGADRDTLYDQCVAFVLETRKASASSLQRKFSLGYNRAARIIDQMEENGIVSPLGANGKRDIIV